MNRSDLGFLVRTKVGSGAVAQGGPPSPLTQCKRAGQSVAHFGDGESSRDTPMLVRTKDQGSADETVRHGTVAP